MPLSSARVLSRALRESRKAMQWQTKEMKESRRQMFHFVLLAYASH